MTTDRKPESRDAAPYTLLAEGYDTVMEHIDYEAWADYVHALLMEHHGAVRSILELGCGTGSLALALQAYGPFAYRGTDGSEAMVRVAQRKARAAKVPVTFTPADFRALPSLPPVDAVLLLYDGLNYVLEPFEIATLFEQVHRALKPGGVFVFDQSTPLNSLNHPDGFDDAGRTDAFEYLRTSRYDPATHLHTTLFRLGVDGKTFEETHVQRAYELAEIEYLVAQSPLNRVAAYDGFSLDPADASAERIHWVVQKEQAETSAEE